MKKKSFRSLSVRLPLLFVASVLLITAVVIPLVYQRFHSRMIDQYTRMAQGVTREVLREDPDLRREDHAPLRRRVEELFRENRDIFN